jgi:hypothetical protein
LSRRDLFDTLSGVRHAIPSSRDFDPSIDGWPDVVSISGTPAFLSSGCRAARALISVIDACDNKLRAERDIGQPV